VKGSFCLANGAVISNRLVSRIRAQKCAGPWIDGHVVNVFDMLCNESGCEEMGGWHHGH
jgi:hypothetical protein